MRLIAYPLRPKVMLRGLLAEPEGVSQKHLVVCVHGFERFTTAEKKFTVLSETLVKQGHTVLRIDAEGCGISDGTFETMTVAKQAQDLMNVINQLSTEEWSYSFVGHSLGACVIAECLSQISDLQRLRSLILFGPALDQAALRRYWFVISDMKQKDPACVVTWENHRAYLDEAAYQQDAALPIHQLKTHRLGPAYFQEVKDRDYTSLLQRVPQERILIVHGDQDPAVPISSVHLASQRLVISGGDHDLERPDWVEAWLPVVTRFVDQAVM